MIILGLGNPLDEHTLTPHNAGRLVVEMLAKNDGLSFKHDRVYNARIAKGTLADREVLYMLPETYMNASGQSLAPLLKNDVSVENIIVMYDDIDLPMGTIKISYDRGDGGHNGLKSIIATTGTRAFLRIRIGVCPVDAGGVLRKPPTHEKVGSYLLSPMSKREQDIIATVSEKIHLALLLIIKEGKEKAMTEYNK